MACSCKNKNKNKKAAIAAAEPDVGAKSAKEELVATSVRLEFIVRGSGHPLACEDCLAKHVGTAYVLSAEYLEDIERKTERILCIANIRCAEDHAAALGKNELAELLAASRKEFAATGNTSKLILAVQEICGADSKKRQWLIAIGHMSAAEQALRLCGGDEFADRIRSVRLDWMEKQHENERTQA